MRTLERITIFLGAFLLFLVQPMIGNTLLPIFGGTATVWSVCLATFQILLIAGYCYAHFLGRFKRIGTQVLPFHCGLLFLVAAWIWIAERHRPVITELVAEMPSALGVLSAIIILVAAPYAVLSANSTLVQEISGGRYGLYAISNVGSLAGLWAYPLVFERLMPLSEQWYWFAALCLAYAVMFTVLALSKKKIKTSIEVISSVSPAKNVKMLRYFLLSAVSCFLLNAVSTHLGSDITPLPLLWVALLSFFLIAYILGFTDKASKLGPLSGFVLVPLAAYASWHMGLAEFKYFKCELVVGAIFLFLGEFMIISRLYRERPEPRHLSIYYLMIALGGAFGGSICSFMMPLVSDRITEYPVAIALVAGMAAFEVAEVIMRSCRIALATRQLAVGCVVLAAVIGLYGTTQIGSADGAVLKRYRNFYGCGFVAHRTVEVSAGRPYEANEFRCNGTTHGLQLTSGTWKGVTPTVYYAAHAGGLPLENHPKAKSGEPMRIGLCGMGIGTLASYARTGDFYRFYEINPDVAQIAQDRSLFSFLAACKGTVDVVVDDARRALEGERTANESKYDVIVVDVFNGDSIPPHMATKEAFQLYLDRLEDDGILAFHLSNWHLDLMPIMKAAAKEFGLESEALYCASTQYAFESTWAFLSRNPLPQMFDARCHTKVDFELVPDMALMTDERHSLLPYIQCNSN